VAEFLSEGHKVKVTIMFRGREVFHPELGAKILDHIAEDVAEVGKVETQGRLDGRNMTMVLAPDKKKVATRRTDERSGPADDGRAGDGLAGDGVLSTAADRPAPSTPEPAPAAVTTETPAPERPSRPGRAHPTGTGPDRPVDIEGPPMPKMKTSKTAASGSRRRQRQAPARAGDAPAPVREEAVHADAPRRATSTSTR
jgi:translation initiation factor IF-3